MKFTLSNTPMSAMEFFEFVREADCYPNICIAYRILFTMRLLHQLKEAFQI
jgi:hypothetical protein